MIKPNRTSNRICGICGKEFYARPSHVAKGRGRFCSRKCVFEYFRAGIETARVCEVCSKEFYAPPSKVRIGRGRFCSRKCMGIAYSSREARICETCGMEFHALPSRIAGGRGRFCSNKCRGIATCGENSPHWRGPNCVCEICGKEFYATPYNIKHGGGRFCSYGCRGIATSVAQSGESNPNWKGGKSFEPYPPAFNEALKEQVRERQNHQCFICWLPNKNGKALPVHHVDYDKINNDPDNLVALCSSCHGATGTNRGYWTAALSGLMVARRLGGLEEVCTSVILPIMCNAAAPDLLAAFRRPG